MLVYDNDACKHFCKYLWSLVCMKCLFSVLCYELGTSIYIFSTQTTNVEWWFSIFRLNDMILKQISDWGTLFTSQVWRDFVLHKLPSTVLRYQTYHLKQTSRYTTPWPHLPLGYVYLSPLCATELYVPKAGQWDSGSLHATRRPTSRNPEMPRDSTPQGRREN